MCRNSIFIFAITALTSTVTVSWSIPISSDTVAHSPWKLGVVNLESANIDCIYKNDQKNLSCLFLSQVNKDKVILKHYESVKLAVKDIKNGSILAALVFDENFSDSFLRRIEVGSTIDADITQESEIKVILNDKDNLTVPIIKNEIKKAYVSVLTVLSKDLAKELKPNDVSKILYVDLIYF